MRILVLDDDAGRQRAFGQRLMNHTLTQVVNFHQVVRALQTEPKFDLAFLDHDLGEQAYADQEGDYLDSEKTGSDVARFIARELPKEKYPDRIIVHSWNSVGSKRMVELLQDVGINAVAQPFKGS